MPSSDSLCVGVVGSGARADSIARQIAAACGSVSVFDPSRELREDAADVRTFTCRSPAEVRTRSDVVITRLPDECALREAIFGSAGLMEGDDCRGMSVVLDLSPVLPWTMQDIAARCRYDGVAAFGGSIVTQANGKASISTLYIDSAALDFDKLRVIARVLSDDVVPAGETGSAKTVALLTGLLVGVNNAVVGEALAMGERAGLDSAMLTRLLLKGSGATAVMAARAYEDAGVATAQHAALCRVLRRASVAALHIDHSLYFGSVAIASLLAQRQFVPEAPDSGQRAAVQP